MSQLEGLEVKRRDIQLGTKRKCKRVISKSNFLYFQWLLCYLQANTYLRLLNSFPSFYLLSFVYFSKDLWPCTSDLLQVFHLHWAFLPYKSTSKVPSWALWQFSNLQPVCLLIENQLRDSEKFCKKYLFTFIIPFSYCFNPPGSFTTPSKPAVGLASILEDLLLAF